MIINTYFNSDKGQIIITIFLKNGKETRTIYDLIMDCYNHLQIYSVRKQILKIGNIFGKRCVMVKKRIYRCYRKDFEEYPNL